MEIKWKIQRTVSFSTHSYCNQCVIIIIYELNKKRCELFINETTYQQVTKQMTLKYCEANKTF